MANRDYHHYRGGLSLYRTGSLRGLLSASVRIFSLLFSGHSFPKGRRSGYFSLSSLETCCGFYLPRSLVWGPYFVRFDFSERGSVGAVTSVWSDTADRLVFVEWVPNWKLIRLECEVSLGKVFEVFDMRA